MKSREIPTLVLIVLLCLVFMRTSIVIGLITVSTPPIPTTGDVVYAPEPYTVSKDGIYTVLSNSAGTEVTRNTDAITIINQAITLANTISGSVLIMDEDYSLSGNINMKSNVTVYVQLNVTLNAVYTPTSRTGIVSFRGVTNAHFVTETEPANEDAYPKIIGKGTSNYECGVLMTRSSGIRTTYCSVGKIKFTGMGGYGIVLRFADYNTLNGTYVAGYCKAGGSDHQGLDIRAATYNKVIDCHVDGEKGQGTYCPLYLGGDQGPVTYNEIRGGIYENSYVTHATYWCAEPGPIDYNVCVGTIFRGCRNAPNSATGLKLNSATNSRIGIEEDGTLNPVVLVDCRLGLALADGSPSGIGTHGNVIYAIIRNCRKGSEWNTQFTHNVENNEVHLDIDGNDPDYQKTGEAGYTGHGFGGWHTTGNPTYVQYNDIYVEVRNCQYGIIFAGWDDQMTATQEARYNTFYLDVDAISQYAIYWCADCGGYGRYNAFYGTWRSNLAGNCGSIPNADYVYTDVGTAVVATNTFNPV